MGELEVHRTADGSRTLFNAALSESYHSMYGAITESMHVFIRSGLQALAKSHVDLLEIGLGTGLNLLLTWIEAERMNITVRYTAIEPRPVPLEVLEQVDHCGSLWAQDKRHGYATVMASGANAPIAIASALVFERKAYDLELPACSFDLVYYDAFAPKVQPELWTVDRFQRMYDLMRPGGLLVTYSAKGSVRRAMQQVGFRVDRLPGPPGKQEMLRALKPS